MEKIRGSTGRFLPGPVGLPGLILVLFALMTLMLSSVGCAEEEPAPPARDEGAEVSPIPGLSAAQSRTVEELGYPDHFFISIDPASSDRMETWTYFSEEKALEFDNGRLVDETPLEDESAEFPPTALHPQDFDVLMTPGEAEELLGPADYVYETTDSLLPENTLYVFSNATLIYRNGHLMGVDTQARAPEISAP